MELGSTEEEVSGHTLLDVSLLLLGVSQFEAGVEGAALSQFEAGQEEGAGLQFLIGSTLGGGTQGEVFSLQLG